MLPKNTVIFLEDEPATHLYFVLKGNVAVTLEVEGHRSTVYEVDDRGAFGLSSLIAPHLYSATAMCTQPSLVLDVDAVALRRLMARDHRLGNLIMTALARVLHTRLDDTRRFFMERLALRARPEPVGAV
jgi:CRP-like cAMP-binding protein